MTRELWHRRDGARLPAGPGAGVARSDGKREITRRPAVVPVECFRCAEVGEIDADRAKTNRRRRLFPVRVIRDAITVGSTLLCAMCITALEPLDPDPLTVSEALA